MKILIFKMYFKKKNFVEFEINNKIWLVIYYEKENYVLNEYIIKQKT